MFVLGKIGDTTLGSIPDCILYRVARAGLEPATSGL